MKKLLLCLLLSSCSKPNIIQNMVDSVVVVNGSSGIVLCSEEGMTLVLTAHHVISNSLEGGLPIIVEYSSVGISAATYAYVNEHTDLAIIRIEAYNLPCSDVAIKNPTLGDDIWIAANPNNNTKSLKKGIVSSTNRHERFVDGWELSGGIIFGSSGGGAFNINGELFGIARAVDSYDTRFCVGAPANCLRVALPDIGIFVPPEDIRAFLLGSPFNSSFNYLKEGAE